MLAERCTSPVAENGTIEHAWTQIKTNITEVTREVVGVRPKTKKKGWFDAECVKVIAEREEARKKTLQPRTRSIEQRKIAYAEARKKARKVLRIKKRDFRNQQLQTLEGFYRTDESRKFFRAVNTE